MWQRLLVLHFTPLAKKKIYCTLASTYSDMIRKKYDPKFSNRTQQICLLPVQFCNNLFYEFEETVETKKKKFNLFYELTLS